MTNITKSSEESAKKKRPSQEEIDAYNKEQMEILKWAHEHRPLSAEQLERNIQMCKLYRDKDSVNDNEFL